VTQAALVGLGVGFVNGVLCWAALKWALGKTDRAFYGVWLAGLAYKGLFFAAAGVWLWLEHEALVVPGLAGLIAGQLVVGVIPLKRARKR